MTSEDQQSSVTVVCGLLVTLSYLGLLLVEAGSVRRKNVSTVFTRGFTCFSISVVIFWVCGYAFALSPGHSFIGFHPDFFGLHFLPSNSSLDRFFLTSVVASLPSVLSAGPVAERAHMSGQLVLATLLAGILFPIPAHWVWAEEGWLRVRGVKDTGGALVVHAVGGVAGLVGSLLVGRRAERISNPDAHLPGHSLPLTAGGGGLVVIGMVAKLVGLGGREELSSIGTLASNCLLAGSMGALVALHVFKFHQPRNSREMSRIEEAQSGRSNNSHRPWSFLMALNGFQAGMLGVSGADGRFPSWAALLAGLASGVCYCLVQGILFLCKLDDPVHGTATQLSGAAVGVLVAGLANLAYTGEGTQVAWHLLALLAVIAWTAITSILVLLPLLLCGKLRIIDVDERTGMDVKKIKEQSYHGGHCRDCKSTDHVPRITLPSSQTNSTICRSAIAPITESSFDGAVSFPLPSPSSASPPTATELNSNPISLLPEDSMPLDMEEVRATLRNQRRKLREQNNELRSPPGSLTRARNHQNEERGWGSDEDSVSSENARNAAATAFNKENFNYLQGHVPGLDAVEEGGSNVMLRVVKTTTNTTKVKRTVLSALQSRDEKSQ